ncbi:MAG: N-6 DNA methylase [Gemmatimonadaceae bacterium]
MNYVKSKQRVADHGEVFTPAWLVEAMLDLVKGETERIDARFLEPACGSGNFLVRILQRKLATVELKFGRSDFEKRHYALLAVMCAYGVELLPDNIAECRANMLELLAAYMKLEESDELYRATSYVLSQNLVHGDALKMRTNDDRPITFAEWGYLGKGKFQRRDFRLDILTGSSAFSAEGSLFAHLGKHEIFTPTKTYPPTTMSALAALSGGHRVSTRMSTQASFALRGRNPDVLTCIANLSNDEVFTPPELANRMLDTLADTWADQNKGANIWADKTVKFLDPCTKSGVFLREITSRLTQGLEHDIRIWTSARTTSSRGRCSASASRRSPVCSRAAACIAQARSGKALHRQILHQGRWQHLVQAPQARGRVTSACIVARSNPFTTGRRDWNPTLTRSFIPTTSRLGSPRSSEATCNSTLSSETLHINSVMAVVVAEHQRRRSTTSS